MGKKSEKSKMKAKKRKEEKLRLLADQGAVNEANEIKDPLEDFPAFRVFDKNEIKVHLECRNIDEIDSGTFERIFKLGKDNMEGLYNSCSWGWDEEKKLQEMTEKAAKYLIAREETNEIVGFAHFRFDMDYGSAVLYCYELQLHPRVRRKGLGKFLLQVLELMAFKNNMRKVVLTVLKHNIAAVNFFHSLNYQLDETNPDEGPFEDIPYQILSKLNKHKVSSERRLPPSSVPSSERKCLKPDGGETVADDWSRYDVIKTVRPSSRNQPRVPTLGSCCKRNHLIKCLTLLSTDQWFY